MSQSIVALAIATCLASTNVMAQAKKYKMTTEMPAGITAPAEVKTRLGTLRTKDGFPDKATLEKVFDNLDFQRGVQAVLTGMPAASLSAMRKGLPHRQTVNLPSNWQTRRLKVRRDFVRVFCTTVKLRTRELLDRKIGI